MAVYTTKGNSLLGTLGGIATIGGALIPGAQWLTPLGIGMKMMNGGGGGAAGLANQVLSGILCEGWANPASGNIAKSNPDAISDEELFKKWGQGNPMKGAYNGWQR